MDRATAFPLRILASAAVLKTVLLVVAFLLHAWTPFAGSNAQGHYIPVARRLLTEGRFNGPDSRPDSKVGPGYPLVLAACMKVAGDRFPLAAVVVHVWGDFAAALALYFLLAGWHGRAAAVAAGLLWQLFPPEVILSTWIAPEPLFSAVLTIAVVILARAESDRSLRPVLIGGALLGLSTYLRGTTVPLPFLLAGVFFAARRFRQAIALCAAAYALIVPWTVRNDLVLHDPILMSVGLGSVMLQGASSAHFLGEDKAAEYPLVYAEAAKAGILKPLDPKESGIDGWMGRVGLYVYRQRWKNRPLSFAPFALHKIARMWYGTESGGRSQWALAVCSLLVAPAGLWQIIRWRRSANWTFRIFAVVVGWFIVLHFVTLPEFRYILPVVPLLIAGLAVFFVEREWLPGPRTAASPQMQ